MVFRRSRERERERERDREREEDEMGLAEREGRVWLEVSSFMDASLD